MADVFISYARPDRALAEWLAEDCRKKGLSVWWDSGATAGSNFRDEIIAQLSAAKSVFVIWTASSVRSDWVVSEAQRALALGKLIPVRSADFDVRLIPPPFDTIHTPELKHSNSSHIRTAKKAKRTERFIKFRRASALAFSAMVLLWLGWTAREKTTAAVQSATMLIVTDRLSDPQFAFFLAEGAWHSAEIATKINTVKIRCILHEKNCEMIEANIIELNGVPYLQLFRSLFILASLQEKALIAEDDSLECIRRTLAIDRASQSVSLIRTKISNVGRCAAVQDRAVTLTLVEGFSRS